MADSLTVEQRSERMGRVKGRDTKPEMTVRKIVHALGYRYRLHRRDLPGRPDLVLSRHRAVIFVHGCFWHRHRPPCALARLPKSRLSFWMPKLEANRMRDETTSEALARLGWRVLVVWECELSDRERVTDKLRAFLSLEK